MEGSITTADGVEVVRARALQVLPADAIPRTPDLPPPPGPGDGSTNDFQPPHRPMFATDAMDVRFIAGRFHESGPPPPGSGCRFRSLPAKSPRHCSG